MVLDIVASRPHRAVFGRNQRFREIDFTQLRDREFFTVTYTDLLGAAPVYNFTLKAARFLSGRFRCPRRPMQPDLEAALPPLEAVLKDVGDGACGRDSQAKTKDFIVP